MHQANHWKRGASLIEVLVVIIILLIGILAFIRLYPSGFLAIKQSGQSSAAARLAEQELERLKGREDTLPTAIVPVRYIDVNGQPVLQIDPTVRPDDLGTGDTLNGQVDPLYVSGANRIRRILGERANIPLPTGFVAANRPTQGSIYLTTFAPIVAPPAGVTDQTILDGYLLVYGNPMRRFELEAGYFYNFLRQYDYGIDYEQAQVMLRPFRFRAARYKIDYAYIIETGSGLEIRQASTVIILPPANTRRIVPEWVPLTVRQGGGNVADESGFIGVVPDSDSVARQFEKLNTADAWDPYFPYQYKVVNDQLGLLAFNPAAAGFYETYWRGQRPLLANIDYNVHDWSILREERTVPTDGNIKLTFTDIKQIGDILANQTEYAGLGIPSYGNNQPDMVLIDMLSGEISAIAKGAILPGSFDPGTFKLDYGRGLLTFPANSPMIGRKLRILYKVQDEWTLSVLKAAQRYFLSPSPPMPHDGCAFGQVPTLLYFNPSEAGKSVLLREYWYKDANGNNQRGSSGIFRISDGPDTTGYVSIDLQERHPNATAWATDVTGVPIRGIQGVSLKVRLTYQLPGNRPVKIDFDTLVNRKD